MDMTKYKSLFLDDAHEHVDALERDLVQLEQTLDDSERIHEVFRHFHSLKSMAASMGYQEMSDLAHRLEDLMDPHRAGNTPVGSDEIDLLLQGLDRLRRQIAAVADNAPLEAAPVELIQRIELTLARQKKDTRALAAHEPAAPGAIDLPEGGQPYLVQATLAEREASTAVRAFLVYKRLSGLGAVTQMQPPLEEMKTGRFRGRELTFQLVTTETQAEVRRLIQSLSGLESVQVKPASRAADPPQSSPSPKPAAPLPEPTPLSSPASVRVRTDLLDFFVDSVGELITLRSYFEELTECLDSLALNEGVRRLEHVVRMLHDRVMEVRMVAVSLLTQRLPRVCRDLAKAHGKQVNFVVEGEEVELDRALVEALDAPLLHLLRNAVDHGLEGPQERAAAGKPAEGTILLAIRRSSDRVLLTLSDDGQGIDPQRLIERAGELGWPMLEGVDQSPERAFDLIFLPGFSTRSGVSDTSGRGVGLDVVKESLRAMGGRVQVHSRVGVGTSFVMDLPLTLAILQVLLVEAGGYLLAVPASRVLRAGMIRPSALSERAGKCWISFGDESLPLLGLLDILGAPAEDSGKADEADECLVVGEGERPTVALRVRRIAGHREVVLKKLGPMLKSLGPFGGSAVLGDGRPVLILDVDQLVLHSLGAREVEG